MKLIVREYVNSVIEVKSKVYNIIVSAIEDYGKIPQSIGLMKGDLITFTEEGAPTRFPATTTPDKILMSDPTSDTGLKWGTGGGGGGGGGSSTAVLVNNTGATILTGTIVKIDMTAGEREVRKANADDGFGLFVSSDDYATGEEMECYGAPNTICNVLCTADAVAKGDNLQVSSYAGLAEAGQFATVGTALTSKAAGSVGYVKCLLSGQLSITYSTTDLQEGVSSLPYGHLYIFYEEPAVEEEEE